MFYLVVISLTTQTYFRRHYHHIDRVQTEAQNHESQRNLPELLHWGGLVPRVPSHAGSPDLFVHLIKCLPEVETTNSKGNRTAETSAHLLI